MKIPYVVKKILDTLKHNNFDAYVVGGCVRDILLSKTPHDWDITTSAVPGQVKAIFKRTIDTGIKHGTVTIHLDNMDVEVTTYRIESEYKDYRRPSEVMFTDNLTKDLERRDFTMNAIAFNFDNGFVDPFDGISDIKSNLIRGVGDPNERFKEDALRMLRALRFSAQLNFNIDIPTLNAICNNASLIINISVERIRDELVKLLTTMYPEKIVELKHCGLIEYIFPEMYSFIDNENLLSQLKLIEADVYLRLAVFFQNIDTNLLLSILKRFKFDNSTIKIITQLHKYQSVVIDNDSYFIRKMVSEIGVTQFRRLLLIKKSQYDNVTSVENIFNDIIANKDCLFLKDLAINGNILMELGFKGKDIGYMLNFLLDAVLKNPSINTYEQLQFLVKNKRSS